MRRLPLGLVVVSLSLVAACAPASDSTDSMASSSSSSVDAMTQTSEVAASSPASIAASSPARSAAAAVSVAAQASVQVQASVAIATPPPAAAPRVVTVNVENWEFAPAVVNVKKGEKVTLRFVGKTGNHGVAIPGLNVNAYLPADKTVDIALSTDAAGSFDGFCNIPCGPGHRDMTFTVVIS
jgi:cytochrome c oxidase subunit II